MASPWKAAGTGAPGAGGKALRGRRRPAAYASPYLRPEDPPQAENPRWFSGIISGAGRLLSSVFLSHEDGSPSPYSSDAEGGHSVTSDEDENSDTSEEFYELDESEGNPKTFVRCDDEPQSTTQRSERNLIIEQLLLQETFSRVECDRLIKIIQSRVVDTVDGGKAAGVKELPCNTVCSVMGSSGASRSLNPAGRSSTGLASVANHLNDLYPRSIVSGGYSPELCEKAIMEAKNGRKNKKTASAAKSELNFGPCTLNTNALHYEDEVGSPVDMAKSYMQASPPWQSPILRNIQFKTTSSAGMHLCEDRTPYAFSNDCLFRSKICIHALKSCSHDTDFDGTQRMHAKSMVNLTEPMISQKLDSSVKTLELVACANYDSRSLPSMEVSKPVGISETVPAVLAVEDCHPRVIPESPDERIVEDLQESPPMREEVNNVSPYDDPTSSKSSTGIHKESEALALSSVKSSLLSSSVRAANDTDIHASGVHRDAEATKMRQYRRHLSLELLPDFEIIDTPVGSSVLDEEKQKEASGYTAHGIFHFPPGADHHIPESSNGAAAMPVEIPNIQTDALIHLPLKQPENGTTMKSIKQVLADSLDSRRGRGRKVAAKPRRGFAAYMNSSLQPSNDGLAVALPVEPGKLSTDASIVPVGLATSSILKKPERGTTTKSSKRTVAESSPSSRRGRGRKVAAKYKGGRGRGK